MTPASTTAPDAPSVEPIAIGDRVKALREGMGLSLRELADRSGVGAATLSQVERGESSPTLVVAARIADGLELTLSQLLRLDEGRNVAVVRSGTGRRSSRPGHEIEELTPPLPGLRAEGRLRSLRDLWDAVHEGAVKRIRPKTMTVATDMIGLLPLLWATGTGADVTRRLVAPLIGGIGVSFLMELLVYPVIFYLVKRRQLRRELEAV